MKEFEEMKRKGEPMSIGDLANELMQHIQPNTERQSFMPKADVWESEVAYHVSVYLPGLEKDEINLDVKDGYVIVSGERKVDAETDRQVRKLESDYGYFQRRVKLNTKADAEKVKARLENGVLLITIPKLQGEAYARNIKVA